MILGRGPGLGLAASKAADSTRGAPRNGDARASRGRGGGALSGLESKGNPARGSRGTWQRGAAASPGGVQWKGESMVFPIVWQ